MADTFATTTLRFAIDDSEARAGLARMERASEETAEGVKGIGLAVNLAVFQELGRIGYDAVSKIVSGVVELGQRGAQVADVAHSFDTLTAAAGSTSEAMLGKLREGTAGTIDDFSLMQMSAGVLGSGLVKTADDMGALAAGARTLANQTGTSTAQAFDTLTSAMATGRMATLKLAGVTFDAKVETERWAVAHGKTTDKLTESEKAQALAAATLSSLRTRTQLMGADTLDFGDKIDRLSVGFKNWIDFGLAPAISNSPVLSAGMDAIGAATVNAFGGDKNALIQTIVGAIERVAIVATYVGQGVVVVAGIMTTAFYAVKTVILTVETALLALVTSQVQAVAGLVDLASKVPGVGSALSGVKSTADGLAESLRGMTVATAQQTAEAARGVIGQSAAQQMLDKTSGVLITTRATMAALVGTTAQLGPTAAASHQQAATAAEGDRQRTTAAVQGITTAKKEADTAQTVSHGAAVDKQLADSDRLRVGQVTDVKVVRDAVIEAASAAGFKSRSELQETADKSKQLYTDMLTSGKFSTDELKKAWEEAETAKRAAADETKTFTLTAHEGMSQGIGTILGSLSEKHKSAALAGAIISTYQSISKALASAPWPANLVLAAGAAAVGWANVDKIRHAQPGFAQGTPGLDFANFGSASLSVLHGREAVIPSGGGHLLAAEIAAAMPNAGGQGELLGQMREMNSKLDDLPRLIGRAMFHASLLS